MLGCAGMDLCWVRASGEYLAHYIVRHEWPIDMQEFAFSRDFSKGLEALA